MSRPQQISAMPKRIQRQRTRGWRMPPNTVYVGRPTRWGNPIRVPDQTLASRQAATDLYRDAAKAWTPAQLANIRRYLAGKNLACWCPLDGPCHADVLLELANRPA